MRLQHPRCAHMLSHHGFSLELLLEEQHQLGELGVYRHLRVGAVKCVGMCCHVCMCNCARMHICCCWWRCLESLETKSCACTFVDSDAAVGGDACRVWRQQLNCHLRFGKSQRESVTDFRMRTGAAAIAVVIACTQAVALCHSIAGDVTKHVKRDRTLGKACSDIAGVGSGIG